MFSQLKQTHEKHTNVVICFESGNLKDNYENHPVMRSGRYVYKNKQWTKFPLLAHADKVTRQQLYMTPL